MSQLQDYNIQGRKTIHFLYVGSDDMVWSYLDYDINPILFFPLCEKEILSDWYNKRVHPAYDILLTRASNYDEALLFLLRHNLDPYYLNQSPKFPFNIVFNGLICEIPGYKKGNEKMSKNNYNWKSFITDCFGIGNNVLKIGYFFGFGPAPDNRIDSFLTTYGFPANFYTSSDISAEWLKKQIHDYLEAQISPDSGHEIIVESVVDQEGNLLKQHRQVFFSNPVLGTRRITIDTINYVGGHGIDLPRLMQNPRNPNEYPVFPSNI
jgi:hypothetical protein